MNKINEYFATLYIVDPNQVGNLDLTKLIPFSNPPIWKIVDGKIINLNNDELNEICYVNTEITLIYEGLSKTFRNVNGFTVKQMYDNVQDFETEVSNPQNMTCKGFEKIDGKDNDYTICWGFN